MTEEYGIYGVIAITGLTRQANMEPTAPVEETADIEPPAKRKKGSKGYPKGIIDHVKSGTKEKSGKFQARLTIPQESGPAKQKPIPGLFNSIEEAVAVQAAAQLLFDSGGIAAVWSTDASAPRKKRGTVRAHP